ncbi:MAG TPA: ABC transporter permease [Candidatus Krumholzibacteria bacterium]|nr:ABC transporter permease [Candidatus Krumholzibacteria bacterium]
MSAPPLNADRPIPAPVPFGTVFQLVFAQAVRDLVRRRRLLFIAFAGLAPLLLTLLWRNGATEVLDASAFFSNLVGTLYLSILVYLVGLAFGVPTIHDEVEGRTITYLLTRPISRVAVYAGRLAAVQVLAAVLLALSLVLCFAFMVVGDFGVVDVHFVKQYVNHVWIVLLATMVFTGLFAIFGVVFKRPLVWGVAYAFAWEGVVSKIPGQMQTWTLEFHVRNVMMRDEDVQGSMIEFLRQMMVENPDVSPWVSTGLLLVALVAFSIIGGLVFGRREYVVN